MYVLCLPHCRCSLAVCVFVCTQGVLCMPVRPQHELKKCMLVGHANSDLWRSCCTRAVRKKNYLVQLLRMYSTEKLKKNAQLETPKTKKSCKAWLCCQRLRQRCAAKGLGSVCSLCINLFCLYRYVRDAHVRCGAPLGDTRLWKWIFFF